MNTHAVSPIKSEKKCCHTEEKKLLTPGQLLNRFVEILGQANVKTQAKETEYYRHGYRSGSGEALAVVFPKTPIQLWRVLQACVSANTIIIMQAANTGLTEGSTPKNNDYDREVVVVNVLALNDLVLLNQGEQVLSGAGATLHHLENLLTSVDRTPHSVIGSSCLGASIVGGIANNSGGALIKRGPAYTEMALFARVNEAGELELVNHLGIDLGDTPEEILTRLEQQDFSKDNISDHGKQASARDYVERLRDVESPIPARFNADKSRLYEASGCAGKIAVFAVRLDTFPVVKQQETYYIGTNDPDVLETIRRDMLTQFTTLPDMCEYMHRDIFNIAEKYGKDTVITIERLGTQRLPKLFALKGRIDALLNKVPFLPNYLSDHVMQLAGRLFPQHLPQSLLDFRDRYEHHLIMKVSDDGIEETKRYLRRFFSSQERGSYIQCSAEEAKKALLHRFAAAGAAVRYRSLYEKQTGDVVALDIALPRNAKDWVETLPKHIRDQIEHTLYYGHFFCHVFHQDYILKKGADAAQVKQELLALLTARGAKYPAEHNVGHLYKAEPDLANFYKELDPTNTFNPGIGKTSKESAYKRNCGCCM